MQAWQELRYFAHQVIERLYEEQRPGLFLRPPEHERVRLQVERHGEVHDRLTLRAYRESGRPKEYVVPNDLT